MATEQELAARLKRKGAKSGFATDYIGFFDIKPGHDQRLVEGVLAALMSRGPDVRKSYGDIGFTMPSMCCSTTTRGCFSTSLSMPISTPTSTML
ncbi:MAG: hypothetical protein DCF20_07305 [Pseudanabaena sp.]|nr:MAG: hypothetical protein DCF20_07305 [Pseudanabaena sp.]